MTRRNEMDLGLANCEYACQINLRTSMRMHCRTDWSRKHLYAHAGTASQSY